MKLASAEVVLTASGRKTTPFPAIKISNERAAAKCLKAVDTWLMTNALEEARARGDDFNARWMEAALLKPTQADKDCAEQYLFTPQPPVPPRLFQTQAPAIPGAPRTSDEQALLDAGFTQLPGSASYVWVKTVHQGVNRKHLYNAKLIGDGRVHLSRSTSFPGTSVTGSPSLALGVFATAQLALGAAQADLASLVAPEDGEGDDRPAPRC